MPSILSNVTSSEPVTVVRSEDPREPAIDPRLERQSQEQPSSVRSASTVDDTASSPLPNGTATSTSTTNVADSGRGIGSSSNNKSGKNVVSGGPYLVSASLTSVANARSSTSSARSGMAGYEEGGVSRSSGAKEGGGSSSNLNLNGKAIESAGPSSPDRNHPPPTRAPPAVPVVKTRHRRAQSASNATPPSSSSPALAPPGPDASKLETNRLSSPAAAHAFDPSSPASPTPKSPSSSSLPHSGAPRLQHRHTLEVPKLLTGRGSRDYALSRPSEDTNAGSPSTATATGVRRGSLNLVRRATRSIQSDAILDEAQPDSEAARWADGVKQKRASRRKKKDEEDFDRVMVGKKVDESHANWIIAYDMLTGIRFTVSKTNAKMDRELTDADFVAAHKFSFDVAGNELTPSAKYDFKFKDYAPWVFRRLRGMFHLDPADYLVSLTAKVILSELGSPGKSGSFFYFSRDYKYIIKTIHHAEHKLLRKILKDYYEHIQENPNTLISQFYGLHRIKIPYGRKIHFVVMNNLFPPHRDIHQTFDLKGSTIGRDFKEVELEKNPRATLKDLNWLRRNYHLELGPIKKRMFIEQMTRDVALLKKLKIMDYSLLVGIHDLSKGNEENLRDKTLQVFQPQGDEHDEPPVNPVLNRTPSKVESQRKARELREALHRQKPVPMDSTNLQLPDNDPKRNMFFYSDDGGFQATHENNDAGEEIYYLGIIDCLTHYGFVKRLETFWKGIQSNKAEISPIPPEGYGDRFVNFISGVTMPREEAEKLAESQARADAEAALRASWTDHQVFSLDGVVVPAPPPPVTDIPPERIVVEKAAAHAQAARRRSGSAGSNRSHSRESEIPDRQICAVWSPSAEWWGGVGGVTLPVLEEVGESGSTTGRSTAGSAHSRSRERGGTSTGGGNNGGGIGGSRSESLRSSQHQQQQGGGGSVGRGPPLGGRPPPTPPREPPTPPGRGAEEERERQGGEVLKGRDGSPSLPNPRFSGTPITFLPEGMGTS